MRVSFSKRLFSVLLLAGLSFGLVACDSGGDNGDDSPLAREEAQDKVENADTQVSSNVGELLSGPFGSTMSQLGFFDLALQSFSSNAKQAAQPPLGVILIDRLDTVFEITNGQLQDNPGEYNWDNQQRSWNRVGDPPSGNIAVLNFPADTSDLSNNNATFTLASYQDQQFTIDGDPANIPTSVSANLEVGGNTIFSVDLSNVSFYSQTADDTQVPQSFTLDVLTLPHRHNFALSSGSRSQFEFEFDLNREDNGTKVLGVLVNAALQDDFDQLTGDDAEDIFSTLSGALDVGPDVTVDYDVDVDGLGALGNDPSTQDLNDNFSATMNYQGRKVGDIMIDEVQNQGFTQRTLVLVYDNGDQVPLQQVFGRTVGAVPVTASAKSVTGTLYESVTGAVKSLF